MYELRKLPLIALAAALVIALAVHPASAQTTIVSVSGPFATFAPLQGTGAGAATSYWFETNAYSNVTVSAVFDNIPTPVPGTAYLTTAIGPSATSSDVVASAPFMIPPAPNVDFILFTGLNLSANTTYYLSINSHSNFSLGWSVVSPATLIEDTGVNNVGGEEILGGAVDPTYQSDFYSAANHPSPVDLEFSVTGDPVKSVVPESSSLALILPSAMLLAGLAFFTRRRRSLQA